MVHILQAAGTPDAVHGWLERHPRELGLASLARTRRYERRQLMQFDN